MQKKIIIIIALVIIIITAGVLIYFFVPKEKLIFFMRAEKPTKPYITPMSVLDPLNATAGVGEPKIEYFEK